MTPIWKLISLSAEQEQSVRQLEKDFDPLLSRLLAERNVCTFEEARQFFRPALAQLHDPYLMKDMDRAVERLNRALQQKEKILVYGDYDVDGTTAVAMVFGFLSSFTPSIGYYIPDRNSEGYGISTQSIEYAHREGYTLIIALDCGIKAVDKIALANSYGIDFIICDHHTADNILPDAVAVLDPKRNDCHYPYEYLSGCGVGFKLLQAFSLSNEIPFANLEKYIDLVAVSIASDIVPITGENRVLAFCGLAKLNSNPSFGLKHIIEVCNLSDKEIDISDVVFKIGPRINASGRMRTGNEVVELLITNNVQTAREKCSDIDAYNNERRDLDKRTTDEAKTIIPSADQLTDTRTLVVYNQNWNKGIVGIVASRLAEEFHKPTIVLAGIPDSDMLCGSARSVPGFDLYNAIDTCRSLLVNFGGHMYAAGLSLPIKNLETFKQQFEASVRATILPEQLSPQVEIDAEITLKDITPKFVRILKQFNPFGPCNMKPVFQTRRVFDRGGSRLVGKEQKHLKLEMVDDTKAVFSGIAFASALMRNYDMATILSHLKQNKAIDICYTVEENIFNGKVSTQLMICDIRMV
ncbi:MAG: single-stranded-DNA-specific exonuclease RecJ [Prevotellaceae bacterium]|jgi:single-stranded-DNA-specific exonuclease|nr:single-stranded-DNA-specific exonuclease RecJ [Prevotellaceae bacterium]